MWTAKTTTQNWITLEGCKLALQSDFNYNNGDYSSPPKKGLKAFSRNYTSTLFDKDGLIIVINKSPFSTC